MKPLPLPDEWVLRTLQDADLSDNLNVQKLLSDFGMMNQPFPDRAGLPADVIARMTPAALKPADVNLWRQDAHGRLEDARWWLKSLRALARVWAFAAQDIDPTPAWTAEGFTSVWDEESCWHQFRYMLNLGLEGATPRAAALEDDHDLKTVGLFTAGCVQVFNLVVLDESARLCQNEKCGRPFTRQQGGAEHGQHRKRGVLLYCSTECRDAQKQRRYRRNLKDQAEAT